MDAIAKTKANQRLDISVQLLVTNELNPNKMKAREWDLLVDNITQTGLTDPILVRPIEDGKYRIIGGHHRFDAAKYLGFTEVPCTVIMDPDFGDDAEKFQLVRMNMIRGKQDPEAFLKLYSSMAGKYQDDALQELFGFADEAEFQRLINQTAKQLPKDMQKKFKEAAKEVKTIDDLAKLLNSMFTKYGSTLPHGFMVLDYGGKESIWVQVSKKTLDATKKLGETCVEKKRSLDDLLGALLQSIASEGKADWLAELVEGTPEIAIPENVSGAPTKETIEQAKVF